MKYRTLGSSEIEVSEIGLGCWALGGLSWKNGRSSGWANVAFDDARDAIKSAVDQGVNHFDNADAYGDGKAERILTECLNKLGLDNRTFVIATKVGYVSSNSPHPYTAANIRTQCERSLRNLGRDSIDIYYLHHDDFGPDDCYLEEAAETMENLRQEGKIRLIGQSSYRSSRFEKIVPIVKPTVLQSWAHMMDTKFVEPNGIVGQLLEKGNLSFIAFSPLNQGILLDKYDPTNPPRFESGDHRENSPKFQSPALERLAPMLKALKGRFGDRTEDLAAVALRFVLNYPNVASAIPGFRNQAQVDCNLSASQRSLSAEDMAFIHHAFARKRSQSS